jgi:hypothetical protein
MILLLSGAVIGVLVLRAWRRRHRADREMAARFVHRDPTTPQFDWGAHWAAQRERMSAERDRRDAAESAQYRRDLEKSRRLHRINNPELYEWSLRK